MSSSSSSVRIGTTIRFGAERRVPPADASGAVEPPLARVGVEDGVPDGEPDGVLVAREVGVVDSEVAGGALTCPTGGGVAGGVRPGQPEPDADRGPDQHDAADDGQDQVAAGAEGRRRHRDWGG